MTVSFSDIEAAAKQHVDAILHTQCCPSHSLTQCTGIKVYVKYENRQHTGAFKVRGLLTKLLTLSKEQRSVGVVAMSAGNHAQGVAYNAKRLGIPATIVMPDSTPFTKVPMPDKPGQLHAVSGICADAGANVLAVEHSRFAMDLATSSARLDITIETQDQGHAEGVINKIKSAGFFVSVKN